MRISRLGEIFISRIREVCSVNKTTLLGFGSSLVNKSFISELLQVGLGVGGMMMRARSFPNT